MEELSATIKVAGKHFKPRSYDPTCGVFPLVPGRGVPETGA